MNYTLMIKLFAMMFQNYVFEMNDSYIKEDKKIDVKKAIKNDFIPKGNFYNQNSYYNKTIPRTGHNARVKYTSFQQISKHRTKKNLKNIERKIQESKSL